MSQAEVLEIPDETTDPPPRPDPPAEQVATTEETEEFITRTGASRGYQGLFRLTTLVIGDEYDPEQAHYSEKEIDVDDRDVKLLFTLEMADDSPWRFRATDLDVTITLRSFTGDFADVSGETAAEQQILLDDQGDGVLSVFDADEHLEIFPGGALQRIINVKTGIFSTPELTAPSANAGLKEFPVTITYELRPFDNDAHGNAQLTAIFVVASD